MIRRASLTRGNVRFRLNLAELHWSRSYFADALHWSAGLNHVAPGPISPASALDESGIYPVSTLAR